MAAHYRSPARTSQSMLFARIYGSPSLSPCAVWRRDAHQRRRDRDHLGDLHLRVHRRARDGARALTRAGRCGLAEPFDQTPSQSRALTRGAIGL